MRGALMGCAVFLVAASVVGMVMALCLAIMGVDFRGPYVALILLAGVLGSGLGQYLEITRKAKRHDGNFRNRRRGDRRG